MVNLQTQLKSEVGVLAEYISDELSVFIVAENKPDDHPANGGLRLLNYETDMECLQDGFRLANLMKSKHDLYSTGFSGGKVVARSSDISSVKALFIHEMMTVSVPADYVSILIFSRRATAGWSGWT